MELTADFSQRVAVHAAQLPWVASPIRWVDRCMLDCIGDDLARATSIVRYAPDSRFSAARVRWSGDPDRSPSAPLLRGLGSFYCCFIQPIPTRPPQ